MNTFNTAVNTKINGTPIANEYEMKFIPKLIDRLERVKASAGYGKYYIEYLPIGVINDYMKGMTFRNDNNWECTVKLVKVVKDKFGRSKVLVDVESPKALHGHWSMWLGTLCKVANNCSYTNLAKKWMIPVTSTNVDSLINHLKLKAGNYNKKYTEAIANADQVIRNVVNSKEDTSVVTREAVRKAVLSVRHDQKVVADAFNSTLTSSEQKTLIDWLKKNTYSMRLYVVKNKEWDKALTEMYPDEQYGKKRRTEATSESKNTVGGYISVNSIEGAPLDIIQKITHKLNKNESFVQNKGSSKYRLNNYMLVLYLLQNYNSEGFITGKTNLNKVLR